MVKGGSEQVSCAEVCFLVPKVRQQLAPRVLLYVLHARVRHVSIAPCFQGLACAVAQLMTEDISVQLTADAAEYLKPSLQV